MPQVGIRELKNDASEIIRAVREERAEYVVTLRGRPVAFIVPVDEARQEAEADAPSGRDPGECRILGSDGGAAC